MSPFKFSTLVSIAYVFYLKITKTVEKMPTMLTFFLRWQIKSQWWRKKTKKQNRFFYPTIQVGLHFKITNTSTPKWLVLLGGSTYIQFLNSGKQKGLHKINRPRKKNCSIFFVFSYHKAPNRKKRFTTIITLAHHYQSFNGSIPSSREAYKGSWLSVV